MSPWGFPKNRNILLLNHNINSNFSELNLDTISFISLIIYVSILSVDPIMFGFFKILYLFLLVLRLHCCEGFSLVAANVTL